MLVASADDSLYLWDSELDRMTVIGPGGRIERTFAFASGDTAARYGFGPAGRFRDGSLLVAARLGATIGERSGMRREMIPLRRASATGAVTDTIGSIPGNEQLVVSTDRYVSSMERPFGRRSVIGTSGNRTLVTTGDRDEVLVISPVGRVEALWRIERAARPLDSLDTRIQRARLQAQAAQLPPAFAAAMISAVEAAGFPVVLPPYDQLIVDETGAVWLRDDVGPVRRDTVAHRWTVRDSRGRWLGAVVTPSRFVVHQVTKDKVVGVWTDEDGVEQVRIYRLRR